MLEALQHCIEQLMKLPTIGRKSASRLALHLLEQSAQEVFDLATAIRELKEKIFICQKCFNYSQAELCDICGDGSRDQTLVCVVEKSMDVFTMERVGRFRGVYHVLGGVLSPLSGVTAEKLRIAELKIRIEKTAVAELIIALGGGADAEATSHYLLRLLAPHNIRISRLARGLPAGMELEFADQLTLTQALIDRVSLQMPRQNKESDA
ncbi:MAG: recombination protein RecR [Chitinivibrionales bacterium]|nr:recombination protein RecR [Chitinivibrionales bacterium]